ncbi:hypothetical protein [Sphingomonas cavernae]|uniref:Uncharacterized protein n=1 Tax=Sphingomonas cavernae TaxID=2320861 RepID=A0A418WP10_9SPHN|nr:hypothetical protein [Sphingomonas cavernae]RJF92959.1 hypothetical protein D3876_00775 [Sphingomonas cavernae]
MFRKLIIASAFAVSMTAGLAAPVAVAQAASAAYSAAETDIGTLLDNPETKAILEKHVPGMTTNPQIDMARPMTLKQVQTYEPEKFSDEVLAKIDADLAKLPAKK